MWLSPGICDSDEELASSFFQDKPGGSPGFAKWENGYISETSSAGVLNTQPRAQYPGEVDFQCTGNPAVLQSAGNGFTTGGKMASGANFRINKRLTAYFAKDTEAGREYVFEFQMTNPLKAQASPSVSIDGRISGKANPDTDFSAIGPKTQPRGCSAHACRSSYVLGGYYTTFCGQTECAFPMDKDEDTVPCCTSCSVAGSAVPGDAAPLKVHEPFFCVKTIGQSSAYPCDTNTLSVTLTANVPMKGGSTVITFSGFNTANAPDCKGMTQCVVDLQEGANGMGQHNWFSDSAGGAKGKALWHQGGSLKGKLVAHVLLDIECTTEVQFSFQLENPSCEQPAQTIQVEAKNVGNSEAMFKTARQQHIAIAPMKADTTTVLTAIKGAVAGDAAPLTVFRLEFEHPTVNQSSSHPCDTNTITIQNLVTSVPIIPTAFCSPEITVYGLKHAIACDDAAVALTGMSSDAGPWDDQTLVSLDASMPANNSGTWNNDCTSGSTSVVGSKTLAAKSLTMAVKKRIDSHTHNYSFAFDVKNPAKGQTAAAVSMEISGCGHHRNGGLRALLRVRGSAHVVPASARLFLRLSESVLPVSCWVHLRRERVPG